MNKVVAILAVIVVITLGALFFFAGYYMGNTVTFGKASTATTEDITEATSDEGKISKEDINSKISVYSTDVSDKVRKIISTSADNVTSSVAKAIKKINYQSIPQVSADSLLKEIIANHTVDDNCSSEKTEKDIQAPKKFNKNSMLGKRVVFIGYFKNTVALQIQQILMNKGYKVHVEESKTCYGESFIFAGPFKKLEAAETLVEWLRDHEFSEAKIVNVLQASVEGALSSTLDDDSSIPENDDELDIPEINKTELNNLTSTDDTLDTVPSTENSVVAPITPVIPAGVSTTSVVPSTFTVPNTVVPGIVTPATAITGV